MAITGRFSTFKAPSQFLYHLGALFDNDNTATAQISVAFLPEALPTIYTISAEGTPPTGRILICSFRISNSLGSLSGMTMRLLTTLTAMALLC